MERILIKEDNLKYNEICNELQFFNEVLYELKKCYEALEIGEFNDAVFKDLIKNGINTASNKYNTELNDQLDSAGINSKVIRENMLAESSNVIKNLQESLTNVKSIRQHPYNSYHLRITLSNISFVRNKFVVTASRESILEEHCRVYIENENEKKIYDSLMAIAYNFNSIVETLASQDTTLTSLGINPIYPFTLVTKMISFKSGEAAPSPSEFKGIATYSARYKKYVEEIKR